MPVSSSPEKSAKQEVKKRSFTHYNNNCDIETRYNMCHMLLLDMLVDDSVGEVGEQCSGAFEYNAQENGHLTR